MDNPQVLTKFTKYYETSFSLDGDMAIKMSLSSEFNDLFDSQISLSREEIQSLATKYSMSKELIKFYMDKMNNLVHIVSFIGKSALHVDTSHMWGIYADNGKGLALEFDYVELDGRANNTLSKQLAQKFYDYDNENYSDLLLTPEDISPEKKNKKLMACNTPTGIRALQHFFSGLNSMSRKPNIPNLQEIYENLKNNIVDKHSIEIFDKLYSLPLNDRNKFLYKIFYTTDLTFLSNALEAYLQYEIQLQNYPNSPMLEALRYSFMKFYNTKSIVWQYENEYRLITPGYTHRDYMKESANKPLEIQQKYLDNFRLNINPPKYFYKYGNDAVFTSEDKIGGNGGVTVINIPFPKKIYLGWKFDTNEDAKNKINIIKRFCVEHNVELFQVEPIFNYEVSSFISHQIKY